jgi:cell division protein FtsW
MVGSLRKRETIRYDVILVAALLLLTFLGLGILYSASYLFALNQPRRFTDGWQPLIGNLFACLIMIPLFPILVFSRFEWLRSGKLIVFLVLLAVVLNLLPCFPYFQKSNHRIDVDAMRWIVFKIGGNDNVSFQPSEAIKVVLPLYLAYILDKNKDRLNSFVYGPLPPALLTVLFCALVLLQSNFSEAVIITLTSLAICFIAGIGKRWFILVFAIVPFIGYKLVNIDPQGRWSRRIASFFSVEKDIVGEYYQISLSLDAIKSGGFWGKGIGQGTLKTRIPEVHGDFVFASFAEESGFLGVLLYFILVGVFAWMGYMVAWRSKDRFIQLVAFGLVTPVVIQSLLNIAVVAGVIPVTGVPLPFVSSGGSSLLMTLIGAALLVNVSRRHAIDTMGGR